MKTLFKAFQRLAVFYTLTLFSWPTPLAAQAQDFTWLTNSGTITITGYIGPGGAVTIPSTITDRLVTTIGANAFNSRHTLTSVTIPDTVTSLESYAFASCSSLTNATISIGVTNIAQGAFYWCRNLPSVIIPDSVTTIGPLAFYYCTNLYHVTIGNGVKTIGDTAFEGCRRLAKVTIPDSVTQIGSGAFSYCTSLTTATIGNGVTTIDTAALSYCTSLTNVTIGNGLTGIWNYALSYCTNLTGIYFRGNAPLDGSSVFAGVNKVTVYYLPGTKSWATIWAGRPTALWRPQVQTRDTSFGVRTNQFEFNIAWASGMNIAVDACTNLATPDWVPLQTNTLTADTIHFIDPDWADHPRRFYRVRWP